MNEEINRDKALLIPVSIDEMNMAKKEADKLGMPVTAFIRLLLKNWADGIHFEKRLEEDNDHR
jgi:antitoxin component of RelBE/YafQ-DinJ toxin-antitoxin module